MKCRMIDSAKYRWMFSAFCTFLLLPVIYILFLRSFNEPSGSVFSNDVFDNPVSVVTVIKKRKKSVPVQKLEKKVAVQKESVIAREPEKKEKIEETADEPMDSQTEETSETETAENTEESESTENISENTEPSLSESEIKALADYKSYALGRIASKKTYPYSARSKGFEGKVRALVVINTDGSVSKMELLDKCEHEVLNEAVLSAVKKSAPFKKLPEGQKDLTLTFVMDFSLKK